MYNGYALDRIHYNPLEGKFSPKGMPGHFFNVKTDLNRIREIVHGLIRKLRVVDAVEYREPDDAWAVPLAYGAFIVAYVKVSYNGKELIPDYGLTEEVRRNVY